MTLPWSKPVTAAVHEQGRYFYHPYNYGEQQSAPKLMSASITGKRIAIITGYLLGMNGRTVFIDTGGAKTALILSMTSIHNGDGNLVWIPRFRIGTIKKFFRTGIPLSGKNVNGSMLLEGSSVW